ncbi:unnamed protein product [Camellia sinensis]
MANTGLAEAYMMRRALEDKMTIKKKKKSFEGSKDKPQPQVSAAQAHHQKKRSNDCFFGVFKKIHPTHVLLLDSVARKQAVTLAHKD